MFAHLTLREIFIWQHGADLVLCEMALRAAGKAGDASIRGPSRKGTFKGGLRPTWVPPVLSRKVTPTWRSTCRAQRIRKLPWMNDDGDLGDEKSWKDWKVLVEKIQKYADLFNGSETETMPGMCHNVMSQESAHGCEDNDLDR